MNSNNKGKNFDCLIFTNENPGEKGICILHITEGISYYPDEQCVNILFDIILYNRHKEPRRCRIIHPGKTSAYIQRFNFIDSNDPRKEILSRLFSKRIKENFEKTDTINFHKRINCVGIDQDFIKVSRSGPGGCFENDERIPLRAEIEDDREYCAFTSYLLPPVAKEEGATICTVQLEFSGESYRQLINDGSNISVESYVYLKSDLQRYALPFEDNDAIRDLYEEKIKPESSIIEPKEYDIVVFQKLGQKVNLSFGSISAPQMMTENIQPEEAICFLGKPKDFCLRFSYPDEVVAKQRSILSNMLVETPVAYKNI